MDESNLSGLIKKLRQSRAIVRKPSLSQQMPITEFRVHIAGQRGVRSDMQPWVIFAIDKEQTTIVKSHTTIFVYAVNGNIVVIGYKSW